MFQVEHDEDQLQQFSFAISHDLGSAIRGMNQLSAMLEQDIHSKLNEKEQYWMTLIQHSSNKAQRMIDALSVYTRLATLEESQVSFNLEPFINEIVADCLEDFKIDSSQLKVNIDLQVSTVNGYPSHWRLLLTELIKNALQFQPWEDELHVAEVAIHLMSTETGAALQVVDNGIGFTDWDKDKITGLFTSHRSENNEQHLGMGLSYCARIAQINCAKLSFISLQPQGFMAEYQFSLPESGLISRN